MLTPSARLQFCDHLKNKSFLNALVLRTPAKPALSMSLKFLFEIDGDGIERFNFGRCRQAYGLVDFSVFYSIMLPDSGGKWVPQGLESARSIACGVP